MYLAERNPCESSLLFYYFNITEGRGWVLAGGRRYLRLGRRARACRVSSLCFTAYVFLWFAVVACAK